MAQPRGRLAGGDVAISAGTGGEPTTQQDTDDYDESERARVSEPPHETRLLFDLLLSALEVEVAD